MTSRSTGPTRWRRTWGSNWAGGTSSPRSRSPTSRATTSRPAHSTSSAEAGAGASAAASAGGCRWGSGGWNTARATLALSVARYTSVLLGVGANVVVGTDGRDFSGPLSSWGGTYHDGGTTVHLYPGFLLGLQIGTPPG